MSNNLGDLLTNTDEKFYFTQRSTVRGSKMHDNHDIAKIAKMLYNHDIFLFQ